ncbi:hypothetical protein RchiOBHm_Chr4g0405221 [Rosa chinensis]|uniref:Uncharacterized protein n=1 Tax=Rosa chinensis TaxID=74649 RepID=A0A2P6QU07_ROSCH|nr:hypothetical protein RchiOBHm_Chr4g0405221 [Rosa chinensis]
METKNQETRNEVIGIGIQYSLYKTQLPQPAHAPLFCLTTTISKICSSLFQFPLAAIGFDSLTSSKPEESPGLRRSGIRKVRFRVLLGNQSPNCEFPEPKFEDLVNGAAACS